MARAFRQWGFWAEGLLGWGLLDEDFWDQGAFETGEILVEGLLDRGFLFGFYLQVKSHIGHH